MWPLLSDSALAAAYLRRLGYNDEEAIAHVTNQPLARERPQARSLLTSLTARHALRVPFENLEQHAVQLVPRQAPRPPAPVEERLARLSDVRRSVERLVAGACGGTAYDLNLAFAWLLRRLGAAVRLAAATLLGATEFWSVASHTVLLVELADGAVLVDVGFADAPRAPVALVAATGPLAATVSDGLGVFEVVEADDRAPEGFSKVLRCKRGHCAHVHDLDDASLDVAHAEWATLYAFRPGDDLAYDAEEHRAGLQHILTPGASFFSAKRFIVLGLPTGHVSLSETRLKRVEGGAIVEEVPVDDADNCWETLAGRVWSLPLLTAIPPSVEVKQVPPVKPVTAPLGSSTTSQAPRSWAETGVLSARSGVSTTGGIAGAPGGLGFNKVGFSAKVGVHRFTAPASARKAVEIVDDVRAAWLQVMDDSHPLSWIYCTYSTDGKSLGLADSGGGGLSEFKRALGDAIAWGGFRCHGVDKRGHLESKRPKFVFVQHKPEGASVMKKAKQGSHKGDVKEVLTGAHLDILVETLDDLDEQALISKLQAATGAHKPNGYEFEPGVFIEADFYELGIGRECKSENARNDA